MHETAGRGFERAAETYERGRPGYGPQVVEWLIDRAALGSDGVLVDVGAGTGKLTRELLARGAAVVAIEPVAAMRAVLGREAAGARVMAGTAEALPLGEASVSAIVVAQAFHWFDGPRALREFHRVTRPGGRLLLVWNVRVRGQALWRSVEELMAAYRADTPSHGSGRWRLAFGDFPQYALVDELTREFEQTVEVEQLVDRVTSTSFIAALEPDERDALSRRLRTIAAQAPKPLVLGYRTEAYAYERQ